MNEIKIGDKVKIINYGHLLMIFKNSPEASTSLPVYKENEKIKWVDMCSSIIGATGIVQKIIKTQGIPKYSLSGINGKTAWFMENQLKLIKE